MTGEDTSPEPEPTAPATLRGRLRERRQEASNKLFLDRPVPRMEEVVVRFKPLPGGRVEQINKTAEKSKDPDRHTIGNATALAECCLGIYEVTADPETAVTQTLDDPPVLLASIDPNATDDDNPVRFDSRLAELLGITDPGKAIPIVREFYLTDGDVTAESNALTAWSGFAGKEQLEEFSGN